MDRSPHPARLSAALERFRLFFDELRGLYLERDDVIDQAAMALLGREHCLITGPPGTAKSGLASSIVGRIVDEASGSPSVFARQITESTVQTDLVGPLNFKALTETGRTEHFTDEGVLGAVHAHLDEVLDGRDMLLRSTLELLHEREMKQGARTFRGAIECALMTTNRYLAEVIEESRERLLAFVDRVAYVGFVPKGFADPRHLTRVLEVQAGGSRPPSPSALLTIQDLDALQHATDSARVDPALFEHLAGLLAMFEAECAAAMRADPSFVPTRYLSTRTAVRLARALKAACVLGAAWEDPERPIVVRAEDVSRLRLSLLLSGPSPDDVAALLGRETDPRERRQLEILRTERDLFDHCLERLPPPRIAPRARPAPAPSADDPDGPTPRTTTPPATPPATPAEPAVSLLAEALPAGLTSDADSIEHPVALAARVSSRADELDRRGGRQEARWLRGRALALLAGGLATADAALGNDLRMALEGAGHVEWTRSAADERLRRLELAVELRATLRARGADEDDPQRLDSAIEGALASARAELCTLWQEGFGGAVEQVLREAPAGSLEAVLAGLQVPFEHMAEADRSLQRLGLARADVRARVVGPRIAPLVARAWQRFEATSRAAVIAEVSLLRGQLHAAGLHAVVPPAAQLEWALEALLRTAAPEPPASLALDRDGYRALRASGASMPIGYAAVHVLVEILADLDPVTPSAALPRFRELLAQIPEPLRERLRRADLTRIEAVIDFLERFWDRLEREVLRDIAEDGTAQDEERATAALAALHESGFFDITTDEGALARFELEAELISLLMPEARESASELGRRAAALAARSRGRLSRIRQSRADARWTRLLGT